MKKEKKGLHAVAWLLPAVMGLLLVALAVYLAVVPDIRQEKSRACGDFQQIQNVEKQQLPREGTPLGVVQRYQFVLEKFLGESTPHLAFYARHQYVQVWIGGELTYSLMPSEENRLGKTVGLNWVLVHLNSSDLGRDITVEITPVYASHADREPVFFLGSELGLYENQLREDLPQLTLSLMAILVGLVFIVYGVARILFRNREFSLIYLGIFAVLIGLWRLTDIRFTAFLMEKQPVLLAYLSIATLMLCMVPLNLYMTRNHKNRVVSDVYCILAGGVCLLQILLQLFGVRDFRETLTLAHVMIVVGVVSIVLSTALNRGQIKTEGRKQMLPLIFLVGVVGDIVIYFTSESSYNLLFTLMAVIMYIALSGIGTIREYMAQGRRLAEQEKQLVEARVAVALSQIQPHFLYNTLNSIAELCYEDPEQARTATVDFAEYLRVNLKSIQKKLLVPFPEELAHVRRYLKLEKMRFEERLNVHHDVRATEFLLPQLSLQPLVENAVKHGIGQKEQGGTLYIKTWEEPQAYVVEISDDGVGFDMAAVSNDGLVHIGIENSRSRLETLCDGTLEIASTPGVGTTATVRIPKERML